MSDDSVPGHYLGVPKDVLTAIGEMMVIAGRVEDVGSQLAAAFNINASMLQFKRMCLEIGKALTRPTPPWIDIDLSTIQVWIDKATAAMNHRNTRIHAAASHEYLQGAWHPVFVNQRLGQRERTNADDDERIVAELKGVYDMGLPLTRDVLFPLTDRLSIQAFAWAGGQPNLTRRYFNLNGETTVPERPTEAQMESSWISLQRQLAEYGPIYAKAVSALPHKDRQFVRSVFLWTPPTA